METTVLAYPTQMNIYSISRARELGNLGFLLGLPCGLLGESLFGGLTEAQTFHLHDLDFTATPCPCRDGACRRLCMEETMEPSNAATPQSQRRDRNPRRSGRACWLFLQPEP